MTRSPEQSPDRTTQLEQALAAARELLADYQRRHEAGERSWATTCRQLEARAAFLESHVRAYEAFQLPGAREVRQLSQRWAAVRAPDPLESHAFITRLNAILGE